MTSPAALFHGVANDVLTFRYRCNRSPPPPPPHFFVMMKKKMEDFVAIVEVGRHAYIRIRTLGICVLLDHPLSYCFTTLATVTPTAVSLIAVLEKIRSHTYLCGSTKQQRHLRQHSNGTVLPHPSTGTLCVCVCVCVCVKETERERETAKAVLLSTKQLNSRDIAGMLHPRPSMGSSPTSLEAVRRRSQRPCGSHNSHDVC